MKRIAAHYILVNNSHLARKSILYLDKEQCVESVRALNHETPSTIFFNGIVFALEKSKLPTISEIIRWQEENKNKNIVDFLKNFGVEKITSEVHISHLHVILDLDFEHLVATDASRIRIVSA